MASVIALVIAKTGLIPTKINALGVEFGSSDQAALLFIAQYVVLFMLTAFLIYSLSDFVLWRTLAREAWLKSFKQELADRAVLDGHEAYVFDQVARKGKFWWQASKPIIVIRCVFDFILPVVISIFAMHALRVTRQRSQPGPIPSASTSTAPSVRSSNNPKPVTGADSTAAQRIRSLPILGQDRREY